VYIELAKADLAIADADAGRKAEAQSVLQDLLQNAKALRPYTYATIYAALGETDKGIEWLAKEKLTHFRLATLKYDPFLDPLRADQRYVQLQQQPVQNDYE